jgi:ABC-type branched-subunit amino acid transport system ATPase component
MLKELAKIQARRQRGLRLEETFSTCETVVKGYLREKQQAALASINEAIADATRIVDDGEEMELIAGAGGKVALVIKSSKQQVNLCEGSAHRALLSVLPRKAILENTGYTQTMILDEPFATLSDDTSIELSPLLRDWGKNMQIILIEQKDSVFYSGADCTYRFRKIEGKTCVEKVEANE